VCAFGRQRCFVDEAVEAGVAGPVMSSDASRSPAPEILQIIPPCHVLQSEASSIFVALTSSARNGARLLSTSTCTNTSTSMAHRQPSSPGPLLAQGKGSLLVLRATVLRLKELPSTGVC
jgi:hypothetical protein